MGFFSWECKGCHESIKAPHSLPKELAWQNSYVALVPGNLLEMGSYDGYGEHGRLPGNVELWHTLCWEEQGKPEVYSGPSAHADDQGYFYDYQGEEDGTR